MIFFKSANVLSSYFLRCDIISFLALWNLNFPPQSPNKRGKKTKNPALIGMKNQKEPLFDDNQVKKTKNKPNTTKKSSWLYSDQKNAQIFRLRSQIECFWQTYWINKQKKIWATIDSTKFQWNIKTTYKTKKKHNAQKSMIRISIPYTNIVGKKKRKSQME